jgi:protein phosphatase 1 regulatory subunit 37
MQARSQTLETLNIGQNKLTNECLHVMKDSLQQNRTLLQLGMQSTHVTCEGAIALAECIADNPVIQVCVLQIVSCS